MRKVAGMLAVVALTGGCAPSGGVRVTLDEYSLRLSRAEAHPGPIAFDIRNVGTITHEFVVLRTRIRPSRLPVRRSVVRLRSRGIELAGRVRSIDAGNTVELTAQLMAGPYVLICNVPGHYQSGMRTGFSVR